MSLTIEEMAAKIEQADDHGCDFDNGRFVVRVAGQGHEHQGDFLVDELDDWGPATIYIGRSATLAARAISAERNR
jgi:hypothetical protein